MATQVAVVGYGGAFNMGRQHLQQMERCGLTPAAVVDLDRDRLKTARQDFPGIRTFTRLSSMLARTDVELVTIITPHDTHFPLALQCLKAGRSVVVEKPMALTTSDCDRLIAEAQRRETLLSTYHNRHWDGHIVNAVRMVESGALGKVYRIEAHMGGYARPGESWRHKKSVSGGILYDWGVHLLEYALQLLHPADLEEVSGYATSGFWAGESPLADDLNEDEAHLVARFSGGKWLSLNMSSVDHHPKSDRGILEITGTAGTYHMFFDRWILRQFEGGEWIVREGKNPPSESQRYYENVAAALRGEADLIITPQYARRPVHILDLAVQSARLGRALPAKYG